jgi:hypothetical protein
MKLPKTFWMLIYSIIQNVLDVNVREAMRDVDFSPRCSIISGGWFNLKKRLLIEIPNSLPKIGEANSLFGLETCITCQPEN